MAQTSVAAPSLISTKLVPPRRSGHAVAREALLARLLEARRMRCIVLQGPAGSGKTSVLTAWQQALVPLGFELAWLSLSPDDDEPGRFLDYLLASLGQVAPAIVREAALLAAHGSDREAIERTVIALVQGLAEHGREVVLVIDDLQHLKDPLVLDGALQFLLDYAPPTFHLVLATRRAVPLALARLHAEGQLLEVDARDLRFSPAETEQFLRDQLGEVDAREARRLHSLSDGWAAGLQLLALNLRHAQPGRSSREAPIHDPGSFAAYFEREVLARLAPDEVDDLVRLAACTRFCARLAAVLLAPPGAGAAPVQAARLIARLENENLFIVPVDSADRERWYRLHPLLREVLLARLHAMLPEDRQQLHATAADWFESQGLVDEAVRYRLDAGQDEAAAELVLRCAEDLQLRGDYRGLAGILRRLPPAAFERHIRLRFLQANLQMRTRQFDAYRRSLAELERDVPVDDTLARFQLLLLQAALHVQRDDTAAIRTLVPQLLALPAAADGWMTGAQKNLLSLLHIHDGEHELARRVQEEGPQRLVLGQPLQGGSSGLLVGRCFVGLSHVMEGNMVLAERHFRDVLRESDAAGGDRSEAACMAAALLGDVLYERSELQAALDLVEPRVELLERASVPDTVLRVLLMLSRAHDLRGRKLECLAYLDRLEDHASNLGLDRLLAIALMEQIRHLLRGVQLAEADVLLERLAALADKHAGSQGTLAEIPLTLRAARIQRALAHGELESAAAQVAALLALCQERGQWGRVARLRLLAAVVEQRCGRAESARSRTLEALALGHRLGLVRTLLDAHPAAAALVAEVRAAAPLDPVLDFYVRRLLAAHEAATQRPAAAAPRALAEPLSQRELEVLRLLALALPNKKIARSLNLSAETVKWHLRNIYRKLGVAERDEAVARARDLGL